MCFKEHEHIHTDENKIKLQQITAQNPRNYKGLST